MRLQPDQLDILWIFHDQGEALVMSLRKNGEEVHEGLEKFENEYEGIRQGYVAVSFRESAPLLSQAFDCVGRTFNAVRVVIGALDLIDEKARFPVRMLTVDSFKGALNVFKGVLEHTVVKLS